MKRRRTTRLDGQQLALQLAVWRPGGTSFHRPTCRWAHPDFTQGTFVDACEFRLAPCLWRSCWPELAPPSVVVRTVMGIIRDGMVPVGADVQAALDQPRESELPW